MTDVALVTGWHPFDVKGLHAAFRSMDGIDFWPQGLEDFGIQGENYDVVVFYNMHMTIPSSDGFPDMFMRKAAERVGTTEQGVVVMHHGLLAFPEWDLWSEIVGIKDRSFGFHMNQEFEVKVADTGHPITSGLDNFTMRDETYTMAGPHDSRVLLVTDHQQSMHALAWTRTFGKSRVFCYQAGHDNETFSDPNYRKVLHRGLLWTAGKL